MRILIVDDSRATLEIVRRGLQKFGYRNLSIRAANNAVEALSIIGQWSPAIVLTDWHMPDISGLSLLREIMKRQMGIKVAMITTIDDDKQIEEALEAGACFVLSKPFDDSDLHDKLLPLVQMVEQSQIIAKSMSEVNGEMALPKLNQLERLLQRHIDDALKVQTIHTQKFDESKIPCVMAMFEDKDNKRIRAIAMLDIYAACIYSRCNKDVTHEQILKCVKNQVIDVEMMDACRKVLADSALVFVDYKTKVSLRLKSASFVPRPFKRLEILYKVEEDKRIDYSVQLADLALGKVTLVGL